MLLFTLADFQQNLANVQKVEALSAELCVCFPREWVLNACVSGHLSVAWVRLLLEKELAPWIQHGRHADSVCCSVYFIF